VSPRGSRGGRRALQRTRVGEVARMRVIVGATRRCVPVVVHDALLMAFRFKSLTNTTA
jgi:hypothetical protein